ncbi:Low affinity immunoglobulin epsilon Fc receptor [Toxocara canis]|uniref:Low affinity immunoglobulin epsilon Fc receptor n=1 Tax=Toxocara canis TaxID=6265 RepID=A0A0B2VS78_TOXCA|nr:Low affinity immunoglobulin epsilon Fc receptor [Toxocara canis]
MNDINHRSIQSNYSRCENADRHSITHGTNARSFALEKSLRLVVRSSSRRYHIAGQLCDTGQMTRRLLFSAFLPLQFATAMISCYEQECECANTTIGEPNLWTIRLDRLLDEIAQITKIIGSSSDHAKELGIERAKIVSIVQQHQTTTSECDPEWIYYRPTSSCYLFVRGRFTFAEAQKQCEQRGSYLTSIHSKEESDFIDTLAGRKDVYWIGLQRDDDGWYWADSSPLNYTKWRLGKPDGCCGKENNYASASYGELQTSEWEDGPGNEAWGNSDKPHNCVCKKTVH